MSQIFAPFMALFIVLGKGFKDLDLRIILQD